MLPFLRKALAPPVIPAAGAVYCAVGDSITDNFQLAPWPGGVYADSLATQFGWTRTAIGGSPIVTNGGSGYTANYVPTISGGTPSVAAVPSLVYQWAGKVTGIAWTSLGSGYSGVPTIAGGGGGTGAVFGGLALQGGAIKDSPSAITGSYDVNRSAIGGNTMQAGGSYGNSLASTFAARVTAYNPAIVSIFLGANDYYQHNGGAMTVANFKATYQTVLTAIAALASVRLVILYGLHAIAINPLAGIGAGYTDRNDMIRHYNQVIAELANANGCVYVPLISMPSASIHSDGVHPIQGTGHAYMFARTLDALTGRI
jgi:lysophospholipase L1-like esterase